jgi:hypothetical protein
MPARISIHYRVVPAVRIPVQAVKHRICLDESAQHWVVVAGVVVVQCAPCIVLLVRKAICESFRARNIDSPPVRIVGNTLHGLACFVREADRGPEVVRMHVEEFVFGCRDGALRDALVVGSTTDRRGAILLTYSYMALYRQPHSFHRWTSNKA